MRIVGNKNWHRWRRLVDLDLSVRETIPFRCKNPRPHLTLNDTHLERVDSTKEHLSHEDELVLDLGQLNPTRSSTCPEMNENSG